MMESPSAPRRSIAAAALRALLAWLIFYVVVSQLMVFWMWNTVENVQEEDTSSEANAAVEMTVIEPTPPEEENPPVDESAVLSSLSELDEMVKKLEQEQEQQKNLQNSIQEKLTRLQYPGTKVTPESATVETTPPKITSLEAFLAPAFHTPKDLEELWAEAEMELAAIVRNNATLAWDELQLGIMSIPASEEMDQEDHAAECRADDSVDETLSRMTQQNHPSLARESDLFAKVQQVEAAFKERLQYAETEELAEMIRLETSKSQSQGKPRKVPDDGSKCIQKDQLIDMLEVGLRAMQSHIDLRDVLERKVRELDDETNVILDASLPLPPRTSDHKPNLRHFLDTPLMRRTIPIWDALFDAVSGYHDGLDATMDALLEQGKLEDGHETIGQVVVARLLMFAGKVDLSRLQVQSKAGILK